MLKVKFEVEFDKDGKIIQILPYCDIPRHTCYGCKFEEWCNRVINKLNELVEDKDGD